MALKKHSSEQIESIKVFLDENNTPKAFKAKLAELIDSGLNEKQAKDYILKTPFEMELYYSYNQGLFMVESEAVSSCDIVNPYNGELMEECDED